MIISLKYIYHSLSVISPLKFEVNIITSKKSYTNNTKYQFNFLQNMHRTRQFSYQVNAPFD